MVFLSNHNTLYSLLYFLLSHIDPQCSKVDSTICIPVLSNFNLVHVVQHQIIRLSCCRCCPAPCAAPFSSIIKDNQQLNYQSVTVVSYRKLK